jgi:hypothetical protein
LPLSSCLSTLLSLLSQRLTIICLPSSYNVVVVEVGDASCVTIASKLFLLKLLLIELVAAVAAVGSCAREQQQKEEEEEDLANCRSEYKSCSRLVSSRVWCS